MTYEWVTGLEVRDMKERHEDRCPCCGSNLDVYATTMDVSARGARYHCIHWRCGWRGNHPALYVNGRFYAAPINAMDVVRRIR